jgi:IPT/TIG domain
MNARVLFSKRMLLTQSFLILAIILTARPSVAGDGKAGLSVASPTVPRGGLLQMQVFMTEPKPILKGKQGVNPQAAQGNVASPLGSVRDAAIFSPGGDVSGVAVTESGATRFFFSSPLGTFGESSDTPVITLAYPVRSTAVDGQSTNLMLDADDSQWLNPKGKPYQFELSSGAMTVGGTLSISDVVPGAGTPPAGTLISIVGVGFEPESKVDFGEAHVATTQYVNSKLIQVTLRDAAEIRGQRIRIDNPDNERAVYFPYQRTKRVGKSKHALVAAAYPLFSQTAQTVGYFQPTLQGTVFSGIALQNLNSTTAKATVQLYSQGGVLLSTRKLSLATNTYLARDLVELFPGVTPGDGTELMVTSPAAIQMLGLLGDDSAGTLLPVAASPNP